MLFNLPPFFPTAVLYNMTRHFFTPHARLVLIVSCPVLFFMLTATLSSKQTTSPIVDDFTEQAEDPAKDVVPQLPKRILSDDVTRWHTAGYRGQGLKVAILDSGWKGYRSFLDKGLPATVKVRSFRADGNLESKDSQHGILCAEVIHALAPKAELLFANWEPDHPASFLEAVRWAREQGANVVSCSCIMPNWSDGEGGGSVHESLAKILGSGKGKGDMVFCGCVGNTARRHWSGNFTPDNDGFHQWSMGRRDNALKPWGDERVSVELYTKPGASYEIVVVDSKGKTETSATSRTVEGRCTATARFEPRKGEGYQVKVRQTGGKAGRFHLVSLQGDLGISSSESSICFPGDGQLIVGVGAVDANGRRCSYSACGPNSVCPKPDVVAAVPFVSLCRTRPFAGTSAATPQAAASAIVLWSRNPTWTADVVRTQLTASARDLGPQGHDREYGHGLIRLPDLNPVSDR